MDDVELAIPGYKTIQRLGQSRQTDVWLAEQESLRRLVTLKILRPQFAEDPAEVERFVSEAKVISQMNHASIVQVYDVSEFESRPFLVIEYVTGPSIDAMLGNGGSLEVQDAITIAKDIASALAYAYESCGLIHRNITPKSIYLDEDEAQAVKLAYVGLSLRVDTLNPESVISDGMTAGTPYYMAPEFATAPMTVDCRSDIYALGASLYHMLTGVVPFGNHEPADALRGHVSSRITHPKRLLPSLPPGVGRVLERMLMKDPERRFANWEDVTQTLSDCLNPRKTYVRKGVLEGCTLEPANAVRSSLRKRSIKLQPKGASKVTNDTPSHEEVPLVTPHVVAPIEDPDVAESLVEDDAVVPLEAGPVAAASELRSRLLNRERVVGTWIQMGHPASGEILAEAGFDWVAADMEHTDIDVHGFTQIARGVYGRGPEMWARVRENDTLVIRQVLDAGAQGVIVPLVDSVEHAQYAVASARFPPDGVRGFSFSRMNDWGLRFDEYAQYANASISVIVMIESVDACNAIEEIMAVEGVDGAFIGPYDLSGSMGVPGQTDHPDLLAACDRVVEGCAAAGKSAGLHIVRPDTEAISRAVDQGFNLIALGMDTVFIAEGAQRALAALD